MKILLFDLSRTLLFPVDYNYKGELNELHREVLQKSNYNFLTNFRLDESMMSYLDSIKDKYGLYIFTSGSIQNAPEIKSRLNKTFNKIYSSIDFGLGKQDPKSYKYVANDIGVKPEEILFIDDLKDNIEAAKKAGLKTTQYKTRSQVIERISKFK